jgi:hypothetical protein
MQTAIPTQTEGKPDYDELLVASIILMDVNLTVRDIRMLVMVLLRYVAIGASIADGLMQMVMPDRAENY